MIKAERDYRIAELIAESEEFKRFEAFYNSLPDLVRAHKTKESHLPLIFLTSAGCRN